MDKADLIQIFCEISVAVRAVEVASNAVRKATRAYRGCQLPSGAIARLGSAHTMLLEEQRALAEELSK